MKKLGRPIATSKDQKLIADVIKYQDAGDELRKEDLAAVARGSVALIRKERAKMQGAVAEPDKPVIPDGRPRAFLIDSIRHPAEVGLLRRIYGDAFVLIGVVSEHDERLQRISGKYEGAGEASAKKFMQRIRRRPRNTVSGSRTHSICPTFSWTIPKSGFSRTTNPIPSGRSARTWSG